MSTENPDFIVIGAGHNGLIAANYLARTGASVLVYEKRLEAGGGLSTEEVTLPGFYHNLHSFFHDTIDIMPAYRDLKLDECYAEYVKPPVQLALITKDNRALTIHTDLEKTVQSIEKFSKSDAKAYAEAHEEYREYIETVVVPALYSPPSEPSEQIEAMQDTPEGLEYLRLMKLSPTEVLNEMFESDTLRAAILYQLAIPRGAMYDYAGTGFFIPMILSHVEESQICRGGSHRMAHALWKALLRGGGGIRGTREVEGIVIEKNRAVGVKLVDGEIIRAKKGVISSVDLHQTFTRFVGEKNLDEPLKRAVKNYQLDDFSIFSVHLALNEPPRYTAAAFDADVNQALKINIGFDSTEAFREHWNDIRRGRIPAPRMYCSTPTLFDPGQAPEGKHTAFLWFPVPYRLAEKNWESVKEEVAEICLAEWRKAAPNLTNENIIARKIMTPEEIDKKFINMREGSIFMGRLNAAQMEYFRPHPSLSQYRTPIEGLYLCGACTHPGGGIIGGGGYIAAGVIADDFDLDKWWE